MVGTFLNKKSKHRCVSVILCLCFMLPNFILLKLVPILAVTYLGVTINGVWIGELDLLTICTHHSEL
jgi:hypothetical protein